MADEVAVLRASFVEAHRFGEFLGRSLRSLVVGEDCGCDDDLPSVSAQDYSGLLREAEDARGGTP